MADVVHGTQKGNTSRPGAWLETQSKERLLRKAEALGHKFDNPKKITAKKLVALLRTD